MYSDSKSLAVRAVIEPGQHIRCNLCGASDSRVLLTGRKRIHSPQHLVIYRYCMRCSFVFLDLDYDLWIPTYEYQVSSQDDVYFEGGDRQQDGEAVSVIEDVARVYPAIRDGRGRTVADIGAGVGGSLRPYRAMGWNVTGVEYGRPQALYAQRNGIPVKNELYQASTYPPGSLDFIHCYHVLEHLALPYAAIRNFHTHLKTGGYLYVEVPNVLDTSIYQLGFGHVTMFSPTTLSQTLTAAGFDVISQLDRSNCGTFGMGFLCRASERQPAVGEDTSYLPVAALGRWQKDARPRVWWRSWYAFHIGRGREALTWRAPVKMAWRLYRPLRSHA